MKGLPGTNALAYVAFYFLPISIFEIKIALNFSYSWMLLKNRPDHPLQNQGCRLELNSLITEVLLKGKAQYD